MKDTKKIDNINKLLKMNAERAKMLAKINDTYIVYSSKEGVIREFPDGKKVIVHEKKQA